MSKFRDKVQVCRDNDQQEVAIFIDVTGEGRAVADTLIHEVEQL